MTIKESISGTGKGVTEVATFEETNIEGSINEDGTISVTGTKLYNPELYKAHLANVILVPVLGSFFATGYQKMHWTDVLAFSLVIQNLTVDEYQNEVVFAAGKRQLDKINLILIGKEIAGSGGTKDWNLVMKVKNEVDPIIDDKSPADSPFNPKSEYYDVSKPIFTYDPDNGYIIYKSGKIIWTTSNGHYYDEANGEPVSYDKTNHTVIFDSGTTLNLKTLERTTADKEVTTIKNTLTWYQAAFRKLMTDTGTQLAVVGILILLLIVKAKRNAK